MEIKFRIQRSRLTSPSCPRYKFQRKPSFPSAFQMLSQHFVRFTRTKLFNRLIQILLIHLFESNALYSYILNPEVKPIFRSKRLEFPAAGKAKRKGDSSFCAFKEVFRKIVMYFSRFKIAKLSMQEEGFRNH